MHTRTTLKVLAAAVFTAFALSLTACGMYDVPEAKSALGRQPDLPEVPEKSETVRGDGDPPIVTLKIGSALRAKRITAGEPLPVDVEVPTTNLQNVPVTTALEAVLEGTDISITYEDSKLAERTVNLLNLSGNLPDVVDRICNTARLFCSYRNGSIDLLASDTFMVDLPGFDSGAGKSGTDSISEAIKAFTNEDVQIDSAIGKIVYKSDYTSQLKVQEYLEELRNGRPLVVMQMYIWEVSLDADNALGISWDELRQSGFGGKNQSVNNIISATDFAPITGGISLGALLQGQVDSSLVANFLSTQGVVQTLSNPQLTFVSGSETKFTVGGKRRFVSQVGTPTSSTTAGTTTTSNSTTIQTEEIDTGLAVTLKGNYENGAIFSTLKVEITDIIATPTITTGGVTLQLPETSNRELETVLRVRPGDNLLLAGMTSSRDESDNDNLPLPFGMKAPLRSADSKQNRELVILIKPSIILFADDKMIAEARAEEAKKPLPEPVVIDAAGSRPVSFLMQPEAIATQADEASSVVLVQPGDPFGFMPPDVPVGKAAPDEQMVNSSLLQRGLSYAFDEMLLAPPTAATAPLASTPKGTTP